MNGEVGSCENWQYDLKMMAKTQNRINKDLFILNVSDIEFNIKIQNLRFKNWG